MTPRHGRVLLPVTAGSFGDPYVTTLDAFNYTFNAVGEFWLVKHDNFSVQARWAQAQSSTGQSVPAASVLVGVAATIWQSPIVTVALSNNRTGEPFLVAPPIFWTTRLFNFPFLLHRSPSFKSAGKFYYSLFVWCNVIHIVCVMD